jgi:hypothetical protein
MTGKRKWIIVSVVGTAALLVSGIIGGVVYAQSGSSTSSTAPMISPMTAFADKVASILKLDNATVENAFTQAQSEMQKDQVATQLKAKEAQIDKMVTEGKLTADQATQYKTWLESKPDVNIPGLNNFGGGFGGMMGGHRFGRWHGNNIPAPTATPIPSTGTN